METQEEKQDTKEAEILFDEKDYGDKIGITYEFVDQDGKKWIQSNVAEHMLGVGYKQFDRYCKELNVEKQRHRTKRYSYNFIKENDVETIADHFDKALKRPWNDIPYTDDGKKVLSKGDAQMVAEQHMAQAVATYQSRISKLEDRNDNLNDEIRAAENNAQEAKNKEKNWKVVTLFCVVVFGVAGYFVWDSWVDWDKEKIQITEKNGKLENEIALKNQDMTSKEEEIKNLNLKLKEQEIEFLKEQSSKEAISMNPFDVFENIRKEKVREE